MSGTTLRCLPPELLCHIHAYLNTASGAMFSAAAPFVRNAVHSPAGNKVKCSELATPAQMEWALDCIEPDDRLLTCAAKGV